jgi:hypothetical protein
MNLYKLLRVAICLPIHFAMYNLFLPRGELIGPEYQYRKNFYQI